MGYGSGGYASPGYGGSPATTGGGGGTTTTVTAADTLDGLTETADARGTAAGRAAADTLDGFHEAANVRSGPITVQPRPAVAGTGPAQTATPAGAGGIGGGVDLPMRIVAWDCTVADEGGSTLSFTLARPPPSKAPTPAALYFPQLIAKLQQRLGSVSTTISLPPIDTGGGGGVTAGISEITSIDGSVTVAGGAGPVTDLSVNPDIDTGGGGTGYPAIPFIFAGPLTSSQSPAITPHATTTAVGLSAMLGTASSGSVVVTLEVNYSPVASVTIPAGSLYAFTTFSPVTINGRTDSYCIVVSATPGSGADLGGEIELS